MEEIVVTAARFNNNWMGYADPRGWGLILFGYPDPSRGLYRFANGASLPSTFARGAALAGRLVGAAGVLAADDVSGVGAVDDVAIPVLLAGAAVAYDASQRTFLTYTLSNPAAQIYVGRTSGYGTPQRILTARYTSHHMRLLGFGSPSVDRAIQGYGGYPAIRGREQQLMDFYGGVGSPGVASLIRGVSSMNPAGLIYHEESDAYFGPLAPYTGYWK